LTGPPIRTRFPKVKAAQCLLRQGHYYDGRVTGRYDRATARATRRLQRALNAARDDRSTVSGGFTAGTTATVKRYQQALGLPATGVATSEVWAALRQGRR